MTKSGYPPDWEEIAREAKDRAYWSCAKCGHPHDPSQDYMLTVHHIDGDKMNCDPANLIVLCQRCHLRAQHQTTSWQHKKRLEAGGQKNLFGGDSLPLGETEDDDPSID